MVFATPRDEVEEAVEEKEDEGEARVPESVCRELEGFLMRSDKSDTTHSMTFSETTMTRAQRAKVHALVRRNASLGSRTIPTTNQIRVFRKKAYLLYEEEEEEEEGEETEDEEYTPFELGKMDVGRFDMRARMRLKKEAKINADIARRKYHGLSQRLHPSYTAAGGKKRGWCDECGMLLQSGRWWRCAANVVAAGRDDENDDTEEKEEEETMVGVTDICQVCLEMTKKKKNRRGQKYMEMEKNGQLVLIKDLSAAFGEKGSDLRETYCCSSSDDDDENDDDENYNTIKTRAHKATLDFKKLTVAYLCFKDPSRTEIYETFGFEELKKHEENYSDVNIFECDPWEIYEDFFEGKDEDDRQYLLFNGIDVESSDSEENMMDDDDGDDDSEENLNLLKRAKEMAKEQEQQEQKKVIMSKSASANEVLKFPFQQSRVCGTHDRFVDEEEEEEKKEDIWQTTISKAAAF